MIKEDKQLIEILDSIQVIESMLRNSNIPDRNLVTDLHDAIKEINKVMFGSSEICLNKATSYAEMFLTNQLNQIQFTDEVEAWRKLIITTIHQRSTLKNNLDRDFYHLIDHIRVLNREKLTENVISNLNTIRATNESLYQNYIVFYTHFKDYWGDLDLDNGKYGVIDQRVNALIDHLNDFLWLYERLSDYRSKNVLYGILYNWIYFDCNKLIQIKENNFADYYDLDLLKCDEKEVLVDIGAYTGDSAKSFIDTYGNYNKIYCYEITSDSFEKCKKTLSSYDNIIYRNCGAGSKNAIMYLKPFGLDGSSNTLQEEGSIPVSIVTIDEDIKEKITLIKMDIEGAEQDALLGCREHITNEHPKLAICTYHNNEDIWKIPRMIDEMYPDYKFYMRYNGKQPGPTEYVLFAL